MAQVLSTIPVYQINSDNKLSSPTPTYIPLPLGNIESVQALSGPPKTVNGAYVYSVISMPGTVQNPGNKYYTSLTAAAVVTLANT